MLLGIDIGGTFTDFVYYKGNCLRMHKVLSTPEAPEQAILQGLNELEVSLIGLSVVHGSTVATNAVLEGKGARTVYISNHGLKDVLTIGRQARRELYNLQPQFIDPPVASEYCLETGGRLDANGNIIEPLTDQDIADLIAKINELDPEAAAINLLFSFIDNQFEKKIEHSLPDNLFVSCSSDILQEQREYERGITTWLNAYVGPLMQGYLQQLESDLKPASLSIMRSSGETCSVTQGGKEAVHLLLSGPAGGLRGAQFIAQATGSERIMTFDMGGTSTDVALVDGEINLTSQGKIANYPVGVPMADIHTIGAGGGSIAYLDAGGALQVGPGSAGACPGPACYGQGGQQPTVTDANLILGHLPRSALLGGTMALNYEAAQSVLHHLITKDNPLSIEQLAAGIVKIANEHMVQALRTISVYRGIDPRSYTLVAFGGAGGMHVCALAEAMGIKRAMAPVQAGVLSALGMIVSSPGRQLSKTVACLAQDINDEYIKNVINELATQARQIMLFEGIDLSKLTQTASLDICYRGQSFTLNIPWDGLAVAEAAFHDRHKQQYGHSLAMPVEVINVRLGIKSTPRQIELEETDCVEGVPAMQTSNFGHDQPVPVWQRQHLSVGKEITGPAVIMDETSTTYIASQWLCTRDHFGNLLLQQYTNKD